MAGAFQYKPRFVDIRVRPPSEKDAAEHDVNALKPGERACDHPDCLRVASARAPKARDMLNEHYWFCQPHAAEYNRNWNFFAGLPEGEVRRRQQEEMMTGGRPTWEMKAGRMSREAAAFTAKFGTGQGYRDPFSMFGGGGQNARKAEPERRKLGKIERNALADLDLDENADTAKIRARYTELVRRLHPDANNGDRSGENRLQRVIRSYQSLRKAGLA
ncbi:MAG: DnaJ domain-containing protein [Alphaproteobacteria bacterium]|nr:DnaJ domain-containing protein [Alphaproteobacteria bacterium]MBU1516347.1 DnaJ domain-containing protein [Alphaproteobacteria bacterium]MBU2093416.1 DnaJ domain-containing protein [Alphaproteobacteria bacterium]MBU2153903.1 DnaJ domain-containing protein [Alphaproteobacteria bacterium]MBU2307775.1 DnaJ domain-containing protein [Alphaproteobacteria bacterium]